MKYWLLEQYDEGKFFLIKSGELSTFMELNKNIRESNKLKIMELTLWEPPKEKEPIIKLKNTEDSKAPVPLSRFTEREDS